MSETLNNLNDEYKQMKKEVNSKEEKQQIKQDYKEMKTLIKGADKLIQKHDEELRKFNKVWDKLDKEYLKLGEAPTFEEVKEELDDNQQQFEEQKQHSDEVIRQADETIKKIDEKLAELEKRKLINMSERNDKIRGSLIGGAIGDALGYQIEFKRGIENKEVTKYQSDKGIISDDTQMCLFTANALLWRETRGSLRGIAMVPARAIYEAYLDWLDTQNNTNNHNSISWIKEIPELNIERAPGNTCLSSLSSGKMGTIDEPINNSKGCGGIMRVAPIGLYAKDSITAGKVGAESSAITHGHSLGILPCYILASMLNMIVYNNETIEVALDKSVHQYYDEFNKFNKEDVNYLIELINKAKKLAKENISDVEAISSLGEGWVAEETFAIAIYSCLKYSNSFQDAIVCSVNHDGDSDSTGAVAGNIIGAYLGYDAIPSYYKDNVELKDVILELADDMSIDVPISEYSSNEDKQWENKYLYCKYSKVEK